MKDGTEAAGPPPGPVDAVEPVPDWIFRAMVEHTVSPFLLVNNDGTIRFASQTVEDLSGWRPDELVGRNMIEFVAPDERTRAIESFASMHAATDEAVGLPIILEVLTSSGEIIWCEVGAFAVPPTPGQEPIDGTVLRLRSWSHNHHFNRFLEALLSSQPFSEVAGSLCRSISLALMAEGALLHHGFDGSNFLRTDGAGVPLACAPSHEGPWREAAERGAPVFADVTDLPPRSRLAAEGPGFSAIWCTPIEGLGRLPKAVLSVWRREPGPPRLGTIHAFQIQARYAQLALERWAEHQRLIHIAGHDNLTGVWNRSSFRSRLAQALAIGEEHIAVAFCDLDSFKPVNDTYGHQTGDKVLVEVANRLRRSLRSGDELARLGGDEFTVLMRGVPDAVAAEHLAQRILDAMHEPFEADGTSVEIGISVGIALVGEPTSADEVLALADGALYEAKGKGGNQAHVTQT